MIRKIGKCFLQKAPYRSRISNGNRNRMQAPLRRSCCLLGAEQEAGARIDHHSNQERSSSMLISKISPTRSAMPPHHKPCCSRIVITLEQNNLDCHRRRDRPKLPPLAATSSKALRRCYNFNNTLMNR